MMQPDLTRPGAEYAFGVAVSAAIEAATRPSEDSATVAGYAFARLHHLVDGRNPKTHEALKATVFAAASEAILRSADLPADS